MTETVSPNEIQPVPQLRLSSRFPTNADRPTAEWNGLIVGWGTTTTLMASDVREVALNVLHNAQIAKAAGDAAVPAAQQVAADRAWMNSTVLPACSQAVAARDQAVPAAARSESAATRAETAAASIQGGPITSITTPSGVHTGAVGLALADLVAAGDIVAYGSTAEQARERIGAAGVGGQQTFTASTTINKSMFGDATFALVELWGAGASGNAGVGPYTETVDKHIYGGNEGGSYQQWLVRVADLPVTAALVVGAGGARVSRTSVNRSSAQGIGGGGTTYAGMIARGGAIILQAGLLSEGAKSSGTDHNGGAGGGNGQTNPQTSTAPVKANTTRLIRGPGGDAVGGGGGGGASGFVDLDTNTTAAHTDIKTGGTSTHSGNGGDGVAAFNANCAGIDGVAPSGAGGSAACSTAGTARTVTSGAGARGQARFTWW